MAVSTPELPERAGVLPERLQNIARTYLGARRQSGVSLLEAARHLSEARLEAKHGEWAIFLEAIGLDESRARAQIRIHEEAQRDPMFADRIVNGFLSETVARELLPAPPEVREEVLSRETPPTLQDVRNAKRVSTPDLPPQPAPASSKVTSGSAPATDTGRVAHIRRYLDQQRTAGRIYDKATFNAAWELAHEIHDGDTWRAIAHEIHAQTNGGKGAPVAPPPPTVPPSEIAAPFWQSMSPNHPTAHLWTRTGMNEHHAACGMVTQRSPSGSTETGHCSSCVRATWPQNRAAEQPADTLVAPSRLMCPTCGEVIVNGIWGELNECGSCHHARQQALALRRPRRPVSADVSAQIRYTADLESYATALEQLVVQLRALKTTDEHH
jgi:hypothetical protein